MSSLSNLVEIAKLRAREASRTRAVALDALALYASRGGDPRYSINHVRRAREARASAMHGLEAVANHKA